MPWWVNGDQFTGVRPVFGGQRLIVCHRSMVTGDVS
jgi:hypothetical protein